MNNSINRDFPFRFHRNTPANFKSHNTVIPSQFQQYSGRFKMTCLSNSHLSLALLIAKTTDISEALGPVPPANQSALGHTQMPPFSRAEKMSEFFEKSLCPKAEKHPDFQVTFCLQNVTTDVKFDD
jgi:hypothetical protein